MDASSAARSNLAGWLSRGWAAYTSQPAPLIAASLVLSVVTLPVLVPVLPSPPAWAWAAMAFSMLLIYPVLLIGWCALLLKAVRGRPAHVADLLSSLPRLGPSWGTGVLVTVLTFVGSLLIVPGILVWCAYMCALFAVLDRGLSPGESLALSARISKGHRGRIFGVWCLSSAAGFIWFYALRAGQSNAGGLGRTLYAIGLITLLVDAVVVTPWTCAANAVAYDDLMLLADAAAVGTVEAGLTNQPRDERTQAPPE